MVDSRLFYPQSIDKLHQEFLADPLQRVSSVAYASLGELPHTTEGATCLIVMRSRDLFQWQSHLALYLQSGGGLVIVEEEQALATNPPEHPAIEWYPLAYLTPTRWNFLLRQFLKRLYDRTQTHFNVSKSDEILSELNELGIALSSEKDLDKLLRMIAAKAMKLTNADGCSIYLIEQIPDTPHEQSNYLANKQMRFHSALNLSRDTHQLQEKVLPLDFSTVNAYVARTSQSVRIDDVYELQDASIIWGGRDFDEQRSYRTRSMLAVPMCNERGEVLGVIQLINCKLNGEAVLNTEEDVDQMVIPFSDYHVRLMESLASQATVAVRNASLLEAIQILFDGFINASVKAIESRDPTTSGHSSRVASLTVALAETVSSLSEGRFADISYNVDQFNTIRYASLLHDFGKIGVREKVLVKSKKLYPEEQQAVMDRFRLIRMATELQYTRKQLNYLLEESQENSLQQVELAQQEMNERLLQLDGQLKFIVRCNEPTVLDQGGFDQLQVIAAQTFPHPSTGLPVSYLSTDEAASLSVPKGSLNQRDRNEIESHVTHTYNFLRIIPWSEHLEDVPDIAYAHHEKMNGKGYPRQLCGSEIPLQSKMMTIADIYDALTAWDRPYKKAMPAERALKILGFEAKDNHIDPELLEIFIGAKLYDLVKRPEVQH
jgi:HD-GYP domain-containing protein (c-di-GMP phosphodiesterase class II)